MSWASLGKRIFFSKILWGAVLGGLVVWSLLPYKEEGRFVSPGKEGVTLYQATLVGRDRQGRLWEIRAGEIWQSTDGRVVVGQNIEQATIFRKNGEEWDFSFCSAWARLEREADHLTIGGGIRGQLEGGTFTTEEAVIDLSTRELLCPQPLIFDHDDLRIYARRMEGNFDTELLVFQGEVTVEKSGEYLARGEILRYWRKEERYELAGGVELEL